MIIIDGSYKEGGGQIIRTALALSALTGQPFRAEKIRFNRPVPGLKRQHLACIDALRRLTNARVRGAELKSPAVEFTPGLLQPGHLKIDIGTAGSITLLLQSLLLPCMFAAGDIALDVTGGTDTKWSIPIDYFARLIVPHYNDIASIQVRQVLRGFFPKGQGHVSLSVCPAYRVRNFESIDKFIRYLRGHVSPVDRIDRPLPTRIRGIACASEVLKKADVCGRMAQGAMELLSTRYPVTIEKTYDRTASTGAVVTLWAESAEGLPTIGADGLGERGVRAETVGNKAAARLLDLLKSDAAVDCHLADNLIPLMALTGGRIKTNRITGHILSNIYACEKFLPARFHVDETRNIIETA